MALVDLLHVVLIAAGIGTAYDVARRILRRYDNAPNDYTVLAQRYAELRERVDENERAFKATLLDWRSRFNELDSKVQSLPGEVQTKVAGTVAAIGALPSAPKQWR